MKMTKFYAAGGLSGCGRRSGHRVATVLKLALAGASVAALAACSTGASVLAGAANGALEAIGLKSSSVPESQKPPREVPLKLTAGTNLNAATDKRPVALVVRLYSLKDPTSFLQAPYDTFIDPAREKQTLGADLVQVREMTLIPGQRYDFTEKVSREASALGIVALFRSPASQRWKFAFNAEKNEKAGIMIGLHACAMTLTTGTPTTPAGSVPLTDLNLLSPASCGS
jgi:type VI secretion system protein VasD